MTLYEITAIVLKDQQDGTQKKVTEKYLARMDENIIRDAILEVETQLAMDNSGESEVTAAKKTKFAQIFGESTKEGIFAAKVSIITIDEKTAKEKRTTIEQVVWADSLDEARKIVEAEYVRSMFTYKITDIHETAYVDII